MLDSGQMPPKEARQPTDDRTGSVPHSGSRGYLTVEANARAGDPGRVVLRRLSNAEYTYTLRDLTGVDRSSRPASSRSMARRAKGSRTPATPS